MSSDIEVYVAVGEENLLAGHLYPHSRRGSESASFIYNGQYLANPAAYALDPGLPLVAGTLQTPVDRALFGAIADSLPDRWGRTLIQRAERARAAHAGLPSSALCGIINRLSGRRRRAVHAAFEPSTWTHTALDRSPAKYEPGVGSGPGCSLQG